MLTHIYASGCTCIPYMLINFALPALVLYGSTGSNAAGGMDPSRGPGWHLLCRDCPLWQNII